MSYPKIEYQDFYQQGWLTVVELRESNASNDVSYFCVAVKRAMYRQVEGTSSFTYMDTQTKWLYISGHEVRLEQPINDEGSESTLQGTLKSNRDEYKDVLNRLVVSQVLKGLSDEDRVEAYLLMSGRPPVSRKRRENLSKKLLEGKDPYIKPDAPKKSEVLRVTYDKSKDRWTYYERIDGKKVVLIRSKSQQEVEEFALARQA